MGTPTKDQLQEVVFDIVLAVVLEEVAAKGVRRLRYGRRCPECGAASRKRRPLRRLGAAVVAELALQGADEILWQRRRMRAALDRTVASQRESAGRARRARIPQQRGPRTPHVHMVGDGTGAQEPVVATP